MSDEYRVVSKHKFCSNILEEISRKILLEEFYEVIEITKNYIVCVNKEGVDNEDLIKWGGNFIINNDGKDVFLTINNGVLSYIKEKIKLYFKEIDFDVKIEGVE